MTQKMEMMFPFNSMMEVISEFESLVSLFIVLFLFQLSVI